MPLPVRLARGTIDAAPELAKAARALARPQRDPRQLPTAFGATAKAEFSPGEYTAALGTSVAAGSWLRAILVARLTDTTDPARVRPLPPEETQQVLQQNCFTPHDEFWTRPWLVPRTTPEITLRRRAQQLIRQVAADVPGFEVNFGVRNPLDELDKTVRNLVRKRR